MAVAAVARSPLPYCKNLAGTAPGIVPPQLLVGTETSDDAAVLSDQSAASHCRHDRLFMPIVDDPHDFGRIAATNAISDVYAMGGTPLFALALVGMPVNVLPLETIGKILQGGEDVCRAAGIPIAGGHTIDSVEPIYGLVAIGIVNPAHLKRNSGAKPGDKLILGKPLGVGVYSAALKKDQLLASDYQAMVATDHPTQHTGAGAGLPGWRARRDRRHRLRPGRPSARSARAAACGRR